MRPPATLFADSSVSLTRQDLIDLEHVLKDAVHAFLPFASYSLFFPRAGQAVPELRYDHARRELTLPLCLPAALGGECLGVFVARGVRIGAPKTAPAYLLALTTGVLEKLLLYKRAVTDGLTGLANREHFLSTLTREIELIQHCLTATSGGRSDPDLQCYSACLGVVLLDLDRFQRINERYGYQMGDRIVAEVGRAMAEACPRHVTAARIHNDTFGLLVPDASPKSCQELAEQVRLAIGALAFTDEVTGDRIHLSASLGYVNYPQGLRGQQFQRTPREQARILMRGAAKAVGTAKDHGRNRVFAYQDILKNGGRILEMLPMQRLSVSLGRSVGAQEGQRLLIWSPSFQQRSIEARLSGDERIAGAPPTLYKGEIVLSEVQEEISFGEILHAGDPAWAPEPGDRLTLIQERDSLFDAEGGQGKSQPRRDMLSGLYAYRDFLSFFSRARQKNDRFCVVLTRVLDRPGEDEPEGAEAEAHGSAARPRAIQQRLEGGVLRVAELAGGVLGAALGAAGGSPEAVVGGRFGLGGLVHFLPGVDTASLEAACTELARRAGAEHGLELAVGIAGHPFLHFGKAEMLECARKALEHALLLPAPRVAVFGSVSLNVAADRLFMEGDLYAAVEEFKLSLLADPGNMLARNSLGICYAQLGKADLARREFEQVVEATPSDVMAWYNLGWACQRLGEDARARDAYERCLELDPRHGFSLVRLGGLAEAASELDRAEELYRRTLELPGGEATALRPLARVALAAGRAEQARELLHQALTVNHNDAYALHMLAGLYLESGEDPQIAEVLARQAAALMSERQDFWDVLVRALAAQGKDEEAARAAARMR